MGKSILRVVLFRSDTDSPLVKKTEVAAFVNGNQVPVDSISGGGIKQVTIEPDDIETSIFLQITVPAPSGTRAILEIRQPLRIIEEAITSKIKTRTFAAEETPQFGKNLHPRLSMTANAAGAGSLPEIRVDLMFIDFTSFIRLNHNEMFEEYDINENPEFDQNDPHHGCELHLLEFTRGKPKSWLVILPSIIRKESTRETFHVCLFLRPASKNNYSNTGDVKFKNEELRRYLRDPGVVGPFFVIAPPGGKPFWRHAPRCGFEGQLTKSGKPVILIFPMPHLADFGRLRQPGIKQLFNSLIRALWGDGNLATERHVGVGLGRIAISGFSFGGSTILETFGNNQNDVDELYLFDPTGKGIILQNEGNFKNWLLAKKDHKIRMIAGNHHEDMLTVRDNLLKILPPDRQKDVLTFPENANFWEGSSQNSIFAAAVFEPGKPAERFDSASVSSAQNDLSRDSGIFVNQLLENGKSIGITLQGRDNANQEVGNASLKRCTHLEAAGIIRTIWLSQNEKGNVRDKKSFDELVELIEKETASDKLRHQWAPCGGDGDARRGAAFEGYLTKCLKLGNFL